MNFDLEKVRKIAEEERKLSEIKYKSRFWEDLCGACAICSGRLFKRLQKTFAYQKT